MSEKTLIAKTDKSQKQKKLEKAQIAREKLNGVKGFIKGCL